jgi:hypothetical protein
VLVSPDWPAVAELWRDRHPELGRIWVGLVSPDWPAVAELWRDRHPELGRMWVRKKMHHINCNRYAHQAATSRAR